MCSFYASIYPVFLLKFWESTLSTTSCHSGIYWTSVVHTCYRVFYLLAMGPLSSIGTLPYPEVTVLVREVCFRIWPFGLSRVWCQGITERLELLTTSHLGIGVETEIKIVILSWLIHFAYVCVLSLINRGLTWSKTRIQWCRHYTWIIDFEGLHHPRTFTDLTGRNLLHNCNMRLTGIDV